MDIEIIVGCEMHPDQLAEFAVRAELSDLTLGIFDEPIEALAVIEERVIPHFS